MSDAFRSEVCERVAAAADDVVLKNSAAGFMQAATSPQYSYNFSYLGRPIIQYPQDMVAIQELIWAVRPDLIIETGIAHGGSLIMSASMLATLDYCDAVVAGQPLDVVASKRKVLGIDIDIREHNRVAIESHPMAHKIDMIQGSSIDTGVIAQVHDYAKGFERVLVFLDSNHTHAHVLAELEAFGSLVSPGSYCVVFDTIIEDLPAEMFPDRPWGPGDNPKTAVWAYLESHPEFEIDAAIDNQLLISVAPSGYLRRTTN
jgi:cephalosporin hydroxylase